MSQKEICALESGKGMDIQISTEQKHARKKQFCLIFCAAAILLLLTLLTLWYNLRAQTNDIVAVRITISYFMRLFFNINFSCKYCIVVANNIKKLNNNLVTGFSQHIGAD